jgi:hypothetical protein
MPQLPLVGKNCLWLSPAGWLFRYANGWSPLSAEAGALSFDLGLKPGYENDSACGWADYNGIRYYSGPCFNNPSAPFFGWGSVTLPTDPASCSESQPIDGPLEPPISGPVPSTTMPSGMPDSCCQNLAEALADIAAILKELKEQPRKECNTSCDMSDECVAELTDKVCKKMGGCNKPCGECCDELKLGATMSAEDAASCSRCACDDIENECSAAGLQPGEKCTKCGQENCCCKDDYTCGSCEETPTGKDKFYGWCNTRTGIVVVTKGGSNPPPGGFIQASIADNEQSAFAEATSKCQQKPPEPNKPTGLPPKPFGHVGNFCDYSQLLNYSTATSLVNQINLSFNLAETEQFWRTFSDGLQGQYSGIPIIGPILGALKADSEGPLAAAQHLFPVVQGMLGCDTQTFQQCLYGMTALGLYSQWTGTNLTQFADTLTYIANASCRRKHLSPGDAIGGYLSNALTAQELDAHWAIAGFCPQSVQVATHSSKAKPVPAQLASMLFRELIDKTDYNAGMRQLGYLDKSVANDLLELNKPLPGLSDIVSFMVRDAGDDGPGGVVERFGLDSAFDVKYSEQLKKWSDHQGIDQKIAQYAWRSHWTIPAPQQLFEFYHRLRKNPKFGDVLGDIKAALLQQDILPYWQDHFLAVSFRPIGRVDIRRAYNIGAMNDDDVLYGMQQIGYSDENAAIMLRFFRKLRNDAAVGNKAIKLWLKFAIDGATARQRMIGDGLPPEVVTDAMEAASIGFKSSYAANAFKNGEIPRNRFITGLVRHGVSIEIANAIADQLGYAIKAVPPILEYEAGLIEADAAIKSATEYGMAIDRAEAMIGMVDTKIDRKGALACQSGVKHEFVHGAIDANDAVAKLTGFGITKSRAIKLVGWWNCERISTGKTVATATLCEWRARGAIGPVEFLDRLVSIGYKREDALQLITDCEIRVGSRRAKEDRQRIEDIAKQKAKAASDQQKAEKQIEQVQAKAKRAADAAKATALRRQNQLLKAADKVIRKCDCEVSVAVHFVSAEKARLQTQYGLTLDESLQALLLATDVWPGGEFSDLATLADAHAGQIVADSLALSRNGMPISSSSNGST